MKSPKDQKIIQIEVTNVCMHSCSNCTRFCGHHRKPFFLDFETFKKAVDSLQGYAGMIGLMGGEPTLHPNFEKFAEYLATKTDSEARSANGRFPIRDFAAYRSEYLSDVAHKRGLWTSLGNGYYKHFDIIQKIFEYQCINDHCNPGLHQALMITRKELGIPDEEWIRLRDNCWIQNLWSSSIRSQRGFFLRSGGGAGHAVRRSRRLADRTRLVEEKAGGFRRPTPVVRTLQRRSACAQTESARRDG